MKLHDIVLLETNTDRRRLLEIPEAVNLAKTTYSEYFKHYESPMLYRGSDSYTFNMKPQLIDPTARRRDGSDGTGFGYTEIISNIDSWKGLPRRDSSLISSASRRYAEIFGAAVAVVVLPNQFIGIGTYEDFWNAYEKSRYKMGDLDNVNKHIRKLFNSPKSWEDMINNRIPEYVKAAKSHFDYEGKLHEAICEYANGVDNLTVQSVISFLNDYFDPKRNNRIIITSSIQNIRYKELWTDATCMILGEDYYTHIRKTIKSEGGD